MTFFYFKAMGRLLDFTVKPFHRQYFFLFHSFLFFNGFFEANLDILTVLGAGEGISPVRRMGFMTLITVGLTLFMRSENFRLFLQFLEDFANFM